MLTNNQCALLKQVKPVQRVVQKPCTKEVVVPVVKEVTMRDAFNAFSIAEYKRSKSI
jgi:hypothetical protein